jgi:hypothetical protein
MSAYRWTLLVLLAASVNGVLALPAGASADALPSGSEIVVRQRLPVPPESTWVFVQYGQVTSWDRLRHWYPFCRFELRGRSEQERYVEPGTYRVTRSVRERRTTGLDRPDNPPRAVKVQGGGAPDIVFRSHYELESAAHPEVARLSCEEKFVMMDTQSGFPSLEQIREALGDLADARPAQ